MRVPHRPVTPSPVDCATFRPVEEIAPGIWHWAAPHPRIGIRVHSYSLPAERTVIDPIAPPEGLDWLAEHGPPEQILLTNRHHYRSSGALVERFGASVRCVREGLHEFDAHGIIAPSDPAGKHPASTFTVVNVQGGQWVREYPSSAGFRSGA